MDDILQDKAFEKALLKQLGSSSGRVTLEDIQLIKGILITYDDASEVYIPWYDDTWKLGIPLCDSQLIPSDEDDYPWKVQMIAPSLLINATYTDNDQLQEDLKHFRHIQTLHLYAPTGDLTFLGDFSNLQELYIVDSRTKDWDFLQKLTSLRMLYLNKCHFTDLEPIRALQNSQNKLPQNEKRLSYLGLDYCEIEGSLLLAELNTLEDLNCSHKVSPDSSSKKELKMSERKITIARGLTRMKTIKAQLANIAGQIGQYGAISNKTRHPFGEAKASLEKNHNQAVEQINSLYQQFNDLTTEFVKIKLAIDKANFATMINIGGKKMTIQEALIYRHDIEEIVRSLNSNYHSAVQLAQQQVDQYNRNLNTEGMEESTLMAVMADVLYLVPRERVKEVDTFLVEFMTELDGTLNEINAMTEITL